MTKTLTNLATGAILLAGLSAPALAADVSLARFADCGTPAAPTAVNQRFSDTFAYGELKLEIAVRISIREARIDRLRFLRRAAFETRQRHLRRRVR